MGSTTFQPESGESPTGSGGDQGYLFTNIPGGPTSSTGYANIAMRELVVSWYNAYSDGSFCDNDPTGLTGAAPCTDWVEEVFWSDPVTVAQIEEASAVNPYNTNP